MSELLALLTALNTHAMPFGISIFPSTYDRYLRGKEDKLQYNDYVVLDYVVEDFKFIHYSPFNIQEVIPSQKEDLSFGQGIYCYSKDTHKLFDTSLIAYEGTYTGRILECVYDCDPTDTYSKVGEFLLRTEVPIPVRKVSKDYEHKGRSTKARRSTRGNH